MALSSGLAESIEAVRAVMLTDPTLDDVGIFHSKAQRPHLLPYVLFSLTPYPPTLNLRGQGVMRVFRVQVKVCAEEGNGQSALAVALPLKDAAYDLFMNRDRDPLPEALLNAVFEPYGFKANPPLDKGDIPPYEDHIGDLERWHFGFLFDLHLSRI